jgi:hypothetical protein
MTSFDVALEPAPSPRLAALAVAAHLCAAAMPWMARMPGWLAAFLSLVALACSAASLAAVPGRHHRVAALRLDRAGCRIRLRDSAAWHGAELGPGSRVTAGFLYLELRAGKSRHAWLITRAEAPPAAFRRLKARVRLTC